ncbi:MULTISPECIES: hypothetical protein [unclassified Rathayibacter]|uniref:hypothetical protein n=1 Tax=unclassified Rathayibacter TaxID=2609250 RepID=UPI0011AFFA28|nr:MULTISPECIES: hypothetical protein [unclassified Rathayibacter]
MAQVLEQPAFDFSIPLSHLDRRDRTERIAYLAEQVERVAVSGIASGELLKRISAEYKILPDQVNAAIMVAIRSGKIVIEGDIFRSSEK